MVEGAPAWAADVIPDLEAAKRYVDILTSRGIDWGLLGSRESDRIWSRHVLNSVAVSALISTGSSVADVGSGAGLPGIPLAIARPDLQVTLIESMQRRHDFLCLTIDELRLSDRVSVIRDRAENVTGSFDVVTARAVARLPKLLSFTKHLFLPDGELIALKGEAAADEVREAERDLTKLHLQAQVIECQVHELAETTHVVRVRR